MSLQPPLQTAADVRLDRILAAVSMLTALLGWFFADLMYRRRPQLADAAEQQDEAAVYADLE